MTASAAGDRRREAQERPEEVGRQFEETVEEEAGGVLVGIVAVEVGEDEAGAAEDDMKAVFPAPAAGSELGVEAADLCAVQDPERTLAETAAVAKDATGVVRVGEAEEDAVAGGADAGGFGRDSEAPQGGDDLGAFSGGREHGG